MHEDEDGMASVREGGEGAVDEGDVVGEGGFDVVGVDGGELRDYDVEAVGLEEVGEGVEGSGGCPGAVDYEDGGVGGRGICHD